METAERPPQDGPPPDGPQIQRTVLREVLLEKGHGRLDHDALLLSPPDAGQGRRARTMDDGYQRTL